MILCKKKWKKPLAPGQHLGFFILIQILQNQCIFSVFLIKLTKFGCLLCLNGGSYGPENYFFWSRCGWTSGWWIMTIRNYSIVMDDPSQRHMFLRRRIKICWVLTIKLTTKCAANDLKIFTQLSGDMHTAFLMCNTPLTTVRNKACPPRLLGGRSGDT